MSHLFSCECCCLYVTDRSSGVFSEKVEPSQDNDTLPVAALTKEQLLQALLYLLKVGTHTRLTLVTTNIGLSTQGTQIHA